MAAAWIPKDGGVLTSFVFSPKDGPVDPPGLLDRPKAGTGADPWVRVNCGAIAGDPADTGVLVLPDDHPAPDPRFRKAVGLPDKERAVCLYGATMEDEGADTEGPGTVPETVAKAVEPPPKRKRSRGRNGGN
jgi:hypothetical protein